MICEVLRLSWTKIWIRHNFTISYSRFGILNWSSSSFRSGKTQFLTAPINTALLTLQSRTRRFNTASNKTHNPDQFHPPPILTTSFIILSYFLLSLLRGYFLRGLPTKILYTLLVSPTLAISFTHSLLGELYKSWSSLLCNIWNCSITSSFLCPNFLWALCFQILLSLRSFIKVKDHISDSYKTNGKINVLYRLSWSSEFESGRNDNNSFRTE
jgi:hypothetical protein